MRLSISNSSRVLAWPILALVIAGIGLAEIYYLSMGIAPSCKKDEFFLAGSRGRLILGDSRAETGLVPEVLADASGTADWGNVALPGRSPINEIQSLRWIGVRPAFAVVAVSPASIYGAFYADPEVMRREYQNRRSPSVRLYRWMRYPYKHVEKALEEALKAWFRFPYGFQGMAAVIRYGTVSDRFDASGWRVLRRLGDEGQFTRVWNRHFYREECLKLNPQGKDEMDRIFAVALFELRRSGGVALVRLPCSQDIRAIEDEFYPDFDERMRALSSSLDIPYIGEIGGMEIDWRGSDGSHIPTPEVAMEYTRRLAGVLAGCREFKGRP